MGDTLHSPKSPQLVLHRTAGAAVKADDKRHPGDRGQARAHRQKDGPPSFANLSILAVLDPDTDGEALIRGLQRTHARVSHVWPPPASYPVDVDVVVSELLDDLPKRMPWTPGDFPVALCIVIREHARLNMTALRDSTPHGTISLPLRRNDIAAGLSVTLEQFHYERRLRARIDKLDDYIRAIRSVERAKSVIMARKQIDENEAYHYLRRQAMARRISIGELALAIVDTDQLLS